MIKFNVPPFTGKEMEYMKECVDNQKICGDGRYTGLCNEWIEKKTQTTKCLLTTSCTHALEMAALLADIKEGDEVIMPAYTFVSTADAFVLRGGVPVFVDIRPDTMNIDETLIEAAITDKTKAIAPVHYAGVSCEMDTIMDIAKRHNLVVIEDAAQGIMSTYKGKALGTIGDYGAFSFHETKNYSMGEGGALLIQNEEDIERAEIFREKGTNRSKFYRGQIDKYTWVNYGSSYLPSDMNAAYLYAQLEMAEEINEARLACWDRYYENLKPLQEQGKIELPVVPEGCVHNAHMFYIKAKDLEERTRLIAFLGERDVMSVFHYVPLHTAPAGLKFSRFHGEDRYTTRESERLTRLPMYYRLTLEEVDYICEQVKAFLPLRHEAQNAAENAETKNAKPENREMETQNVEAEIWEWNHMKKNGGKKNVYAEWLAWGVLGAAFLGLLVLNIFWGSNWIDSDMAAEMVFSNLLLDRGEILATGEWYYSTEFRVLYTQLFMEPLLAVFSDWHVVRTITNVICYLLLLVSYFYMATPLKVKRSTVIWSAVLLLLPFSETFVTHVQMGNTYMCHMIIIFLCFGMFLRLGGRGMVEDSGKAERTEWLRKGFLTGCFLLLNMICGLSGVRYLLALQVPLVLTAVVYVMKSMEFASLRREISVQQIKKLLEKERFRYLVYSLLGAGSAFLGYVLNVLVVAKKYTFQTYESTNFISVYQGIFLERLQNTLGSLLMLFGYIPDKGFLSLRGMVTLAGFALLGGICFVTVRSSKLLKMEGEKKGEYANRRFLLWFFVTAFVLNSFVFVFTTSTIVPRYYVTVMMFAVPLLAVYFEEEKLPLDRIAVLVILCGCIGLATMKCVFSFVGTDKNADKRQVAAYLSEEDYDFGYATYWNGNIITELTDGQVEIANINKLEELDYFLWSSPKKYYQPEYHTGKTFLLLTKEEWEKYQEEPVVKEGREVYRDEFYVVLHYDSMEEFQQYREGDRK